MTTDANDFIWIEKWNNDLPCVIVSQMMVENCSIDLATAGSS
jgi:hypothetical protein